MRNISLALREQILRVFKSQTISTGENFEGLNWKFWRIKKFQFYLNNFDMRDVTLWTMLTSIWDTALALFIILSSTFFTLIFGYSLRHDNILHQHVFYMHIKIPYQISEKKYWLKAQNMLAIYTTKGYQCFICKCSMYKISYRWSI